MPHLIALEIIDNEARIVVASGRADRVVIDHALSVALDDAPPGDDAAARAAAWGGKIAAALSAAGIGRHEALMAVGRDQVELRPMVLPPAPDDELPDMVRFQAMREFHQIDDDWLLDYIPLDDKPDAPRNVLAAALDPALSGPMRQTCESAGLALRRLVLRPCASASLFARFQPEPLTGVTLLVDLFSNDVDLTAMLDGRPFFMRTAKLPGDPFESADHRGALLGEIRRTVAAVQNQLGGQRVSTIVLFGAERGQDDLAKMLEEKFETPVHAFDPFAYVQRSAKLSAHLPERSARFAPLLGLVIDELEERAPALDFLKPRQRPKPPSRRNRYASLAVAAAVLLVAYFVYGRLDRAWLERDVANLDRQLNVVRKQAEEATKLEARVKEIERWTADDIVWLDELHLLSSNFPPAKEAMLTRLGMAAQGGVLNMKGLAEAEAIARFQAATREPGRRVIESGSSRDTSQKHYGWNFAASIHVGPEAKK